jgi:hypothetical protein
MSPTTFDRRYEALSNQEDSKADGGVAFAVSEPTSEPAEADITKEDRLAAALRKIDDLERLLQTAASNAALLADKYCSLERDHDALGSKYTKARECIEEYKLNYHRSPSAQRCIYLEHQLNTQLREQEVQDKARGQEADALRSKAEAAEHDNAWLKDTVSTLEMEKAAITQSYHRTLQSNRELDSERSELSTQVGQLTDLLKNQSRRERQRTLSHDLKLQTIEHLEATVKELRGVERHASEEECNRVSKMHEETAMALRGVELKRSLCSLKQGNRPVVAQRVMETSRSLYSILRDEEVAPSGWGHFLLALTSIKDCFADMARKLVRGLNLLR